MEDLKLPIIKGMLRKRKWLSMDNYLRFVIYNLKNTVDIKSARYAKKDFFIGPQFVLK